ncbi:MAG: 8-amino-7-oxononanoate synthase [Planctomycetota bacterium]
MTKTESSKLDFWSHLATELEFLQRSGLARHVALSRHTAPTIVERLGKSLIDFGSNDYLSLSWHPEVVQAYCGGLARGRVGSGSSPVVAGADASYHDLVTALCDWKQAEATTVFSSGYACNTGTIRALVGREDIVFSDALNHACLIDGCQLARCRVIVYPHCDMEALEQLVRKHRSQHRHAFVVTDTVFSMDGDLAPVADIDAICKRYDAMSIADEAHAGGVLGPEGRGLLHQYDLVSSGSTGVDRWIATGTLSKAVGCIGGFVTGSKTLNDWLTHHARSWIYSTALPSATLAAAATAIQLLRSMDTQRNRLRELSLSVRQRLQEMGLSTRLDPTPIIPIYVRDNARVLSVSQHLLSRGLYVPAIRYPTVPRDSAMLRISLNVAHTEENIDLLLESLRSTLVDSPIY